MGKLNRGMEELNTSASLKTLMVAHVLCKLPKNITCFWFTALEDGGSNGSWQLAFLSK